MRKIDDRNCPVRQGGLTESIDILPSEMNARLFREMDSMWP